MNLTNRTSPYWIILTFMVSGCLPSSCSRIESKEISAADSLSRAISEIMPVDTLSILDVIESEDDFLVHPRTLDYDSQGTLWVTDSRANLLVSYDAEGRLASKDTLEGRIPYLAGIASDTVFVYDPVSHSVLQRISDGAFTEIKLQGPLPTEKALTYVTRTRSGFVSKVIGPGFDGYLGIHGEDGSLIQEIALDGPDWRYAGLLKESYGTVYSFVGYRPMIDRLQGAQLDSLVLVGFDSPMLARSRQFVLGSADQPPLLTASAAVSGDFIFVLNMRPGWLRLDVYDLEGTLRYILTQPNPAFAKEFYPSDIAVRQLADPGTVEPEDVFTSGFEIAVALTEPSGRIDRFRWIPEKRDR